VSQFDKTKDYDCKMWPYQKSTSKKISNTIILKKKYYQTTWE